MGCPTTALPTVSSPSASTSRTSRSTTAASSLARPPCTSAFAVVCATSPRSAGSSSPGSSSAVAGVEHRGSPRSGPVTHLPSEPPPPRPSHPSARSPCPPAGDHAALAHRADPACGDGQVSASKVSETEFMQNRSPVGVCGASSNTCPRCDPHRAHRTSVRTIPSERSSISSTASSALGR